MGYRKAPQIAYRPLFPGTRATDNNSVVAKSYCRIGPTRFHISNFHNNMAAANTDFNQLRRQASRVSSYLASNFDLNQIFSQQHVEHSRSTQFCEQNQALGVKFLVLAPSLYRLVAA